MRYVDVLIYPSLVVTLFFGGGTHLWFAAVESGGRYCAECSVEHTPILIDRGRPGLPVTIPGTSSPFSTGVKRERKKDIRTERLSLYVEVATPYHANLAFLPAHMIRDLRPCSFSTVLRFSCFSATTTSNQLCCQNHVSLCEERRNLRGLAAVQSLYVFFRVCSTLLFPTEHRSGEGEHKLGDARCRYFFPLHLRFCIVCPLSAHLFRCIDVRPEFHRSAPC